MTETTFGSVSHDPAQASEPEAPPVPVGLPAQWDDDGYAKDYEWHPLTGGVLVIPGTGPVTFDTAIGQWIADPQGTPESKFQRWTKWVLR